MVSFPITSEVSPLTKPEIPEGEYTITNPLVLAEFADGSGPPAGELAGKSPTKTKIIADDTLRGSMIETAKLDEYARPGLWRMLWGMKAAWELGHASGDATDAHGNGNTLTAVNGPTGSDGWTNFARASNQYFSISSNAFVSPPTTKSLCVMCEVKPASVSNNMVILGKDVANEREFVLDWEVGTGRLRFYCFNAAEGSAIAQTGTSYPFTAGQEYKIVAWLDIGHGTINLEVNGTLFTANPAGGFAITTGTADFRIGARQHAFESGQPFDGAIRRVRILHRAPDFYERELHASRSVPYVEYGVSSRVFNYNNFPYVGTVGSGSTTTNIVVSSFGQTVITNELAGKVLTFDANTTTVALRSDQRTITSNDHLGNVVVPTLDATPVSGDTFTIADPDHAIISPSVRNLTLIGSDLNSAIVSEASGDLCNGITAYTNGLRCRDLTIVGIPGTALIVGKGYASSGGNTQPEEVEENSCLNMRISKCYNGIESRDIDFQLAAKVILANIRDCGLRLCSSAGEVSGPVHAYDCGIGVMFGKHPDEDSGTQPGGSSADRLQVETCGIGWWSRQTNSSCRQLLFFNNSIHGAIIEATVDIAQVVGIVPSGAIGIELQSGATDSGISGGKIETASGGTGLKLLANRARIKLNFWGAGQAVFADSSIEDCTLDFILSDGSMQFDDLAYGNHLKINGRSNADITISDVGDCNFLKLATNGSGGFITITDITGYGNDLILKGKSGALNQIKIDAISGSNNNIWIWTDNASNVNIPGTLGTNFVYLNGVLQ